MDLKTNDTDNQAHHNKTSLSKLEHQVCACYVCYGKTVRLWGEGTFLEINQVQHFTWGPDNTVIYTRSEGSEKKYVAPDVMSYH